MNKKKIMKIEYITREINEKSETRLWREVISQALTDLTPLERIPDNIIHQKQAIKWFLHKNSEFSLVCDLANIDAEILRQNALKIIDNIMLLS